MSTKRQQATGLLVDDDAWFLEEMSEALAPYVNRLDLSSDVSDARRKLLQESYDFVFLDLRLHEEDGLSLLDGLSHLSEKQPAIILVSGLSSDLREAALGASIAVRTNVSGQIQKPVDLDAILDLLDSALSEAPAGPPRSPYRIPENLVAYGLRHHRLECLFQPQYDAKSGQMKGVEALARWRDEKSRELLAPDSFDAFLEDPAYAWDFFKETLDRALEGFASIKFDWPRTKLSFNVVPSVLGDPRFLDQLRSACERQSVSCSDVIIEVVESEPHLSEAQVLGLVRSRLVGFGASLDDFGTGASCIERLVNLPFTQVKIDRWLIQNATSPAGFRFARSVADICEARGIEVVAEGVETEEQLRLVQGFNYDLVQGYIAARPTPAKEFGFHAVRQLEEAFSRTLLSTMQST